MASNDCYGDNYDLIQESIEIKEEKFEIVSASSEPCSSTDNEADEFKETLSYAKIISSRKFSEQLEKPLTDVIQNEEECPKKEIKVKEDKESDLLVSHPEEHLKNQAFCLEGCIYPFKCDSDNVYKSREIQNLNQLSSDPLSISTSDLFGLLALDTGSRAENVSLNYKEIKTRSHVEKEDTTSKNYVNSLATYQLVSTRKDVSCRDRSNNIAFESEEIERYSESGNEEEGSSQLPLLGRNIVVESNGRMRENGICSKPCEITCSKEKQIMETKSSAYQKIANDPENVFSTSTTQVKINSQAIIYECMLCERRFSVHSDLNKHAGIHVGEKRFECEICAYISTEEDNLTRHRRIHIRARPNQCNLCGITCTRNSSLKVHMEIHTQEKSLECKTCGYECKTKSDLKRHMIIHTREKPFKCETCGYKCKRNSDLKKHLIIHTGEKHFKCETCGYKCKRIHDLGKHMIIHTGKEHFKCETCGYKCKRHDALKTHMIIHTTDKPFKCETCGYKCKRNSYLKKHMAIHSKEKPFKPETC